jgi:hypothetical protein
MVQMVEHLPSKCKVQVPPPKKYLFILEYFIFAVKDSTESSSVPHTQVPPLFTSYADMLSLMSQYQWLIIS